jgi:hypothetical protein
VLRLMNSTGRFVVNRLLCSTAALTLCSRVLFHAAALKEGPAGRTGSRVHAFTKPVISRITENVSRMGRDLFVNLQNSPRRGAKPVLFRRESGHAGS